MRERSTMLQVQVRHFEQTLPGLGARRDPREHFQVAVQVLPLDGRHPAASAVSEDISRRGMFMSTATEYPLGTILRLRITTTHGELALTARVVHRLRGIGVGCEFIDLEERERVALSLLASLRRLGPLH